MKYIVLLAWIMLYSCQNSSLRKSTIPSLVDISYPDTSLVDETIWINCKLNKLPNKKYLRLYTQNGFGIESYDATSFNDINANFKINNLSKKKVGPLQFWIGYDQEIIYQGKIYITENPSLKNKIDNYIGPKFLIPNYLPAASLFSTITDPYNNPVGRNKKLKIYQQDDRDHHILFEQIIGDNGARLYFPPLSQKGDYLLSSSYDSVYSLQHTVHMSSDFASSISLSYSGYNGLADGHSLVKYWTQTIRDRRGNTIDDGTLVSFIFHNEKNQKTIVRTTTINGVAECTVPQPSDASIWQLQANIKNTTFSNIVKLPFSGAVSSFQYEYYPNHINLYNINTKLGYTVAEGTNVYIIMKQDNQKTIELTAQYDGSEVIIPLNRELIPQGTYHIKTRILGCEFGLKDLTI